MDAIFAKMKYLLVITLFNLFSSALAGQNMTLVQWNEESKTNIRLLPKYGHVQKSAGQLDADARFIQVTLPDYGNKRFASEALIILGFQYLDHDVKTAMYRFNQAFLLDSTNSDIYRGYGAVYMTLEDYPRAGEQYKEGLINDLSNARILTDYGNYFMSQIMWDSAVQYLSRSYLIDSTNQNTSFKLSACYYYIGDCNQAVYYYKKCQSFGGEPISKDFVDSLQVKCKL
jgi:tetratricopeptide (TPR) repeat protein